MDLPPIEKRFTAIYENAPTGIFETTAKGDLLSVNPACARLFGYDSADAMLTALHNEGLHRLLVEPEILDRIFRELRDGSETVDVTTDYRRCGGAVFTGLLRLVPAFSDKKSAVLHATGFLEDITREKQQEAEERFRREQLIQTDKLASLGILVSGLAHEINNPNHMILTAASTLSGMIYDIEKAIDNHVQTHGGFKVGRMDWADAGPWLPQLTSSIREGAERIRYIVNELREFASQDTETETAAVNLNAVVESAITLMSNIIRKSTNHFHTDYSPDPPLVRANYRRLEQVIVNLLQNACEALTAPGQKITVTTRLDKETQRIVLRIRDEGCGIGPEALARLGAPFFTTKRSRGRAGLGLAIACSILEEYHAAIHVDSEPGEGTAIAIHFPPAQSP
jgi:polar amino acid transport system substrate-binding protein